MKIVSSAILSLLIIAKGESHQADRQRRLGGPLNKIMSSPPAERLYPGVNNAKTTSNGICRLRLNKTGNLMVERKIGGVFKPAWQTGNPKDGPGDFFMAMQVDGNLVVYRENGPGGSDNEAVFATGSTVWSTDMDYKLFLDTVTCSLSVSSQRGTTSGGVLWFSLNDYWFGDNANPLHNTLKKGNLYNPLFPEQHCDGGDCYDLTMYLQNDCNLLIFKGNDLADKGDIVWASHTSNPNLTDCKLSAGDGGLVLYGDDVELWSSDGDWGTNYNVCLDESGPYPCDHYGNPM